MPADMTEQEFVTRLESLKEEFNDLIDKHIEQTTGEDAEEVQKRKVRVYRRIYEEGGEVSKEQFHEIGEEEGYDDKRALGGLFAWQDKEARLKKVEKMSGTEIVLTPAGVEYLKKKGAIEDDE